MPGRGVGWEGPRGRSVLMLANFAGVAAAAAFAARGLRRPDFVRPGAGVDPLTEFWAASSAVRTWALAGPLLGGLVTGRAAPELLAVAGLVQLGDSALGAWQRKADMTVAPAVMGLVHLATAWLLSHDELPPGQTKAATARSDSRW